MPLGIYLGQKGEETGGTSTNSSSAIQWQMVTPTDNMEIQSTSSPFMQNTRVHCSILLPNTKIKYTTFYLPPKDADISFGSNIVEDACGQTNK